MLDVLLGSGLRARLLAWFFLHSGERFFVRQVASILGADSTNVSRELTRLVSLGILKGEKEGRQKYYSVNQDSPVYPELRSLVIKTSGLGEVLRQVLNRDAGKVRVAFLYGSFARGEEKPGSDIDLFVLGSIGGRELSALLRGARQLLAREVNYEVFSVAEFKSRLESKDHFVASLMQEPKLFLVGDEQDLAALAQ